MCVSGINLSFDMHKNNASLKIFLQRLNEMHIVECLLQIVRIKTTIMTAMPF